MACDDAIMLDGPVRSDVVCDAFQPDPARAVGFFHDGKAVRCRQSAGQIVPPPRPICFRLALVIVPNGWFNTHVVWAQYLEDE
jgi:hypothetical protein